MPNQTLLIVGHGSRVAAATDQFNQFVAALAERVDIPVSACFLELADPDMATGLTNAARAVGDGGEVLALPLFLGAAGHLKNDVAAAVQWARAQFPAVSYRYGTPLAPHARLVDLLDLRLQEALSAQPDALPAEDTTVLLVGRGSSDPTSNSEVARTAYLLQEQRPYGSVEYAFQEVARPDVPTGLRRCGQLGAKQIVVAPYILFTGKVEAYIHQAIEHARAELGLPIFAAAHLGLHDFVLDITTQRVAELLAGTAAMTCDICKYRFPLAGYEQQVGQPQTTHHLHGGSAHHHDHHEHHHNHDHEHHHHDHEHEHHH